jgi:hypothetical protein
MEDVAVAKKQFAAVERDYLELTAAVNALENSKRFV